MIWMLALFAGVLNGAGTLPVRPPCRVTPQVIEVGAFYNGVDVRVEGVAAPNSQVMIAVTGPDRPEAFNRKARFGPAWLNAGKVRISGVPSLLLRFTSGTLCPAALRGFDERSLIEDMSVDPIFPEGHDVGLRTDYVALKKADGVYRFADRGVLLSPADQNGSAFRLDFRWPKKAPPAQYQVHVFEIQDETVVRQTAIPVSVVRMGFPAWMAGMAENRASLYGVTAISIGTVAGFGIDFLTTLLFGKKRRTVH